MFPIWESKILEYDVFEINGQQVSFTDRDYKAHPTVVIIFQNINIFLIIKTSTVEQDLRSWSRKPLKISKNPEL